MSVWNAAAPYFTRRLHLVICMCCALIGIVSMQDVLTACASALFVALRWICSLSISLTLFADETWRIGSPFGCVTPYHCPKYRILICCWVVGFKLQKSKERGWRVRSSWGGPFHSVKYTPLYSTHVLSPSCSPLSFAWLLSCSYFSCFFFFLCPKQSHLEANQDRQPCIFWGSWRQRC